MKELLQKRADYFEKQFKDLGFDLYENAYEVVPEEVLLEVMSYGLPTRARHWGYGQSYEYQKAQGEMGYSKVYELIINSDPAVSFLLETNSDIANTLVLAHVQGHNYFFKKNYLFQNTDRKMVHHAAARAQRIEEYIQLYGLAKVEHIMDIAFALEKNIDWDAGLYRKPYGKKEKVLKPRKIGEFDDLYNISPSYNEITLNENFPPKKEYDILWFLANYADIEPWKKDIFEIIREESFYFYPQYNTKILNEATAVFAHTELALMAKDTLLPSGDFLDYMALHSGVVQPGRDPFNINPYYLGYEILDDIRKKAKYDGKDELDVLRHVMENEDDISLLRNHLTQELVDKLGMFTYKYTKDYSNNQFIQIQSKKAADVIESQISQLYNYRSPVLYIEKAGPNGLELVHESTNIGTLDPKHIEKVSQYLFEIWGGEYINIQSVDEESNELHFTTDSHGFSYSSSKNESNKP